MRRDITRHHTTRQNNTKQDTYRTHPVSPYKFHGLKGCWTRIKSIFPSLFQSTIRGRRKSVRFAVTRSKGLSSTSRNWPSASWRKWRMGFAKSAIRRSNRPSWSQSATLKCPHTTISPMPRKGFSFRVLSAEWTSTTNYTYNTKNICFSMLLNIFAFEYYLFTCVYRLYTPFFEIYLSTYLSICLPISPQIMTFTNPSPFQFFLQGEQCSHSTSPQYYLQEAYPACHRRWCQELRANTWIYVWHLWKDWVLSSQNILDLLAQTIPSLPRRSVWSTSVWNHVFGDLSNFCTSRTICLGYWAHQLTSRMPTIFTLFLCWTLLYSARDLHQQGSE